MLTPAAPVHASRIPVQLSCRLTPSGCTSLLGKGSPHDAFYANVSSWEEEQAGASVGRRDPQEQTPRNLSPGGPGPSYGAEYSGM